MILKVEKQFNVLEAQRKALFEEVGKLSHEQHNFKPTPKSWSMLQVFMHLITAESNSLKYMNKKILGISDIPKSGIAASLRSVALNKGLKAPIKYKAPAAALPEFKEIYFFDTLVQEWAILREDLKKLLDQLDAANADKLIYKHPIGGRLNIYQALSFYHEHIAHHQEQIERVKSHANFPTK